MDIDYKIAIGIVGILLLIAQATLIGFKIMEKREAKRFFNGESKNTNSSSLIKIPGFASICIEHAKKLVQIETYLKNLFSQRESEFKERYRWREEVRDNFKRVFDRIEK